MLFLLAFYSLFCYHGFFSWAFYSGLLASAWYHLRIDGLDWETAVQNSFLVLVSFLRAGFGWGFLFLLFSVFLESLRVFLRGVEGYCFWLSPLFSFSSFDWSCLSCFSYYSRSLRVRVRVLRKYLVGFSGVIFHLSSFTNSSISLFSSSLLKSQTSLSQQTSKKKKRRERQFSYICISFLSTTTYPVKDAVFRNINQRFTFLKQIYPFCF